MSASPLLDDAPRDPSAWLRCPEHGPSCVGEDCCCADLHVPPEAFASDRVRMDFLEANGLTRAIVDAWRAAGGLPHAAGVPENAPDASRTLAASPQEERTP